MQLTPILPFRADTLPTEPPAGAVKTAGSCDKFMSLVNNIRSNLPLRQAADPPTHGDEHAAAQAKPAENPQSEGPVTPRESLLPEPLAERPDLPGLLLWPPPETAFGQVSPRVDLSPPASSDQLFPQTTHGAVLPPGDAGRLTKLDPAGLAATDPKELPVQARTKGAVQTHISGTGEPPPTEHADKTARQPLEPTFARPAQPSTPSGAETLSAPLDASAPVNKAAPTSPVADRASPDEQGDSRKSTNAPAPEIKASDRAETRTPTAPSNWTAAPLSGGVAFSAKDRQITATTADLQFQPASESARGFTDFFTPPQGTDGTSSSPQVPGQRQPPSAPQHARPTAQIAIALTENQTEQIELRLNPAELGRVLLRMEGEGESMRVIIAAERADTLDLLRRTSAELRQDLQDAGFSQLSFSFLREGSTDARKAFPEEAEDNLTEMKVFSSQDTTPLPFTQTGLNLRL